MNIRIGSRGSALALSQTTAVVSLLQAAYPGADIPLTTITTTGDRLTDVPLSVAARQDAGLFTSALEHALLDAQIDIAVHSLKDMLIELTPGLVIAAIPVRENPSDVIVSRRGHTLSELPHGATVGSSSRRRTAQLLRLRPDLNVIDLRGNVDTRLRKVFDPAGPYDAIVLAYAGLSRLGRLDAISEVLPIETFLTAPGQGALAIQTRDDSYWLSLLAPLNHRDTAEAVAAERAFLSGLGGGCTLPVGAYGIVGGSRLNLSAEVLTPDGRNRIFVEGTFDRGDPSHAGLTLARQALAQGAAAFLEQES